ncbi:MAG TPA: trehalose-6-phosphate synthase [candidate division Zixibacteria bacterium]|nr:trehalose-6-phosphate synthase [candidate division Zixibacteria bacterium]
MKDNNENSYEGRIIIVSNRLPIVVRKESDNIEIERGSGGLITALAPVLKDRGGKWIGWPGITEEERIDISQALAEANEDVGYDLEAVVLTQEEVNNYYYGFSNEILWPLFHDLQSRCNYEPRYWELYRKVNRKFAEKIESTVKTDDFVWIQDYHLLNCARELRTLGVRSKLAMFLHIPFPPLDIFLKLPWRYQLLENLLYYDLIGFQTIRDRVNFIDCLRRFFRGVQIEGRGQVVLGKTADREFRIGVFPISIDYSEFEKAARSQQVADRAWYLHEKYPERKIILGVDRLDYTKGIIQRLKAFENAIERFPELRGKVSFVQVVVPSRINVPEYFELKQEIERLTSEINGRFTTSGWVPIHYVFRSLDRDDLVALYRTAEIALVTPLKDGMNLVAKEYCASNIEEDGVLILSEFAGAAPEFKDHALLVNPHDIVGVADAIYQAFTMDIEERRARMKPLREIVRENDVFYWVDSFFKGALSRDLKSFPVVKDYVPR